MRERGNTDHDPARRRLLRQSLALAGMAALAAPTGRVKPSATPMASQTRIPRSGAR